MNEVHGFEPVRDAWIETARSHAMLYRHLATGAEVLSLANDCEDRTFGIAFRTPSDDSSGVAHVLEHCALEGSARYPDPRSWSTYVEASPLLRANAETHPDVTFFYAVSPSTRDFYNLVDLVLDAVFHPLLRQTAFDQEAWRYELDGPEQPLRHSGVIYNEMRGRATSPADALLDRVVSELFVGNTYHHSHGGRPESITGLTLDHVRRFHQRFYQPSNAMIFFSGRDDPAARLRRLAAVLDPLPAGNANAMVEVHPPFPEPRRARGHYATSAAADPLPMISVGWALPELASRVERVALAILFFALRGSDDSLLHRAIPLTDVWSSVSMSRRQPVLSVSHRCQPSTDFEHVESTLVGALAELADKGLPEARVEAALNIYELALRRQSTGSERGFALAQQALSDWPYGRDPLAALAFEPSLEAVKERIHADPHYLQDLLQQKVVANPHRVTVLLEPDPDLAAAEERDQYERLAAVRAQMTPATIAGIVAATRRQGKAGTRGVVGGPVKGIPRLRLSDLDDDVAPPPCIVGRQDDWVLLYHPLRTNGIVQVALGFDLHALPPEWLPYVNWFGGALGTLRAGSDSPGALWERIHRQTGGISFSTLLQPGLASNAGVARLFLAGSCLTPRAATLLELMRKVLLETSFDDAPRLRRWAERSVRNSGPNITHSASAFASARVHAAIHPTSWAAELVGGIEQHAFYRRLTAVLANHPDRVAATLDAMRAALISRAGLVVSVACDPAAWRDVERGVQSLVADLPHGSGTRHAWHVPQLSVSEGFVVPGEINAVAKGARLTDVGYVYHGSARVVARVVNERWLYARIRVQGGAYGASGRVSSTTGTWTFRSYRDPSIASTLDTYDQTPAFLRATNLKGQALTRSIIGAIGRSRPGTAPFEQAGAALRRFLVGVPDDFVHRERQEMLSTTARHFREFGEVLTAASSHFRTVVIGPRSALESANQVLTPPLTLKDL